ncbi:MAG: hypothetical protein Harvfovirus22_11 [Harvfovirus sp.]|uniref:Uncharacterized protein n=1 Tax=Harvfovirus sp. TaxID=2487768 RepID=A0A3G5A1Y2_9VIRU|nr:MAG: hypothetical protein Harvfovirus22_11 [Harvfovirus sp.]
MSRPKSLKIQLARLRKLFFEVDEKESDGYFIRKKNYKHYMENIFFKNVKEFNLDYKFPIVESSLIKEYGELREWLDSMVNLYRELLNPKSLYRGRLLLYVTNKDRSKNYVLIDLDVDNPNCIIHKTDEINIKSAFELHNTFKNSAKIQKIFLERWHLDFNCPDFVYINREKNIQISLTNRSVITFSEQILFVVPLNMTRKQIKNKLINWMGVYRKNILEFTGITNEGKIIILKSLCLLTDRLSQPILFGNYLINFYSDHIDVINVVNMTRTYKNVEYVQNHLINSAYYYLPSRDSRLKFVNVVYQTLENFPKVLVEILADYSWSII